jgi:hypothetical protein
MPSQKKDPKLSLSLIAVVMSVIIVVGAIVLGSADEVRFVPRDQYTTTTTVVTLPVGD